MAFVYAAWGVCALFADTGGHAKDLPHHAGGSLHAYGAERDVGNTDVASGHHEVVDISGIEGAKGNRVRFDFQLFGVRLKSVAGTDWLFRVVQIDGPSRGDAGIGKFFGSYYVMLAKDYVPEESAGFTFAADVGDPA